jgi:putative transposase
MKIQALIPGRFFHIYNRGINGTDLFIIKDNYIYFLKLYEKYIEPVADTYAWCLMKNHFHFLVYIKNESEIKKDELTYKTVKEPKKINASTQFGHLFNAYCLAFNKSFKRTGSLFESPFERKLVNDENYFQKLIYYIHYNPVHHRFTESITDYPWSSYCTVLSQKMTRLKKDEVIERFKDLENFKDFHDKSQNLDDIRGLMIDYPL